MGEAFGNTLVTGVNEFSAGIANVITGAKSMRDVMLGTLQVIIAQLVQAILQTLIFKVILGGSGFSKGCLVPNLSAVTDIPKLATGRLISGPGTGTSDSILAEVSAGEFIVSTVQTEKHLNVLEAINSDRSVPAFAEGGLVQSGLNGMQRPVFNIALFNSMKASKDWLDSQPGEGQVVDIVKRHKFEFVIGA